MELFRINSTRAVAKYLGLSTRQTLREIEIAHIEVIKMGKAHFLKREDVLKIKERRDAIAKRREDTGQGPKNQGVPPADEARNGVASGEAETRRTA